MKAQKTMLKFKKNTKITKNQTRFKHENNAELQNQSKLVRTILVHPKMYQQYLKQTHIFNCVKHKQGHADNSLRTHANMQYTIL